MSFYSQQKRRQTIVKAYQRNMAGPSQGMLMVRAFGEARPAIRRNIYIAGRKAALCGDIKSEPEFRSNTLDTSRTKSANENIQSDRLWGKL